MIVQSTARTIGTDTVSGANSGSNVANDLAGGVAEGEP